MTEKKLSGDRNQCQGCKEYFNSTFAFDKHRTGEHGVSRRCLTPSEMTEKGMAVNGNGFWISAHMPESAMPSEPCYFAEMGDAASLRLKP